MMIKRQALCTVQEIFKSYKSCLSKYINIEVKTPSCVLFSYHVIDFINAYIRDIKKFLNQTKEIVFLNIHRFSPETERSAKDSSGHQRLKKQLLAMFEKQMVTYSKPYNRKTFGECWKADHRIFVSYNHRSYDKLLGDKLWPGIQVNHDLFQY